MIQVGAFIFRYRNVLGPVVLVLALVLSHPAYPFGRSDLNTLFDLVGVAVALMGQILRGATIGYQVIIRGGRNRRVYAETLVDTGIFALCRNPLYVGNLLIAVGFALVVHSYAFYSFCCPASRSCTSRSWPPKRLICARSSGSRTKTICGAFPGGGRG